LSLVIIINFLDRKNFPCYPGTVSVTFHFMQLHLKNKEMMLSLLHSIYLPYTSDFKQVFKRTGVLLELIIHIELISL
jgi:hypothetical protein